MEPDEEVTDDNDDVIEWVQCGVQELEESPEAASLNDEEHSRRVADIVLNGVTRMKEPKRSRVLAYLKVMLEEELRRAGQR
ncbi:hypothetical protein [Microbacterium sp. NPDC057961]|uniref:hypothetical protein n=1 Tax=Microbacterium sp. NPDC057961 TaxID=3346289 RepID=UPI0036DD0774